MNPQEVFDNFWEGRKMINKSDKTLPVQIT